MVFLMILNSHMISLLWPVDMVNQLIFECLK